jgi:hypothetical protein
MQPIKDPSGRVVAYTQNVSAYRQEIRDRSGGLLGWFNPETGKTYDRSGSVVSNSGDMRASLIPPVR